MVWLQGFRYFSSDANGVVAEGRSTLGPRPAKGKPKDFYAIFTAYPSNWHPLAPVSHLLTSLVETLAAESAQAQRLIARISEFKHQQKAMERRTGKLTCQLDKIFDALNTNRLEMKDGVLVRIQDGNGTRNFHIEI